MLGDDEAALLLFKQCLDLEPDAIEALLSAQKDTVTAATVRALLVADKEPDKVENGFGLGALELLADTALAEPTEDVLPQSIGPYRVIRMAGAGGTAIVYEAMEAVPRRRVAVKVARATLDPDLHPRFEAEAHALSQVRDEAIPVVYQVGSMVGLPWLAMEWVEGEQLDPATIETPLDTLIAVSRGIAAAHSAGITHGDLSPANILLTTNGPKLVDFGLAGGAGNTSSTNPTGGTDGYRSELPLPPEHADQYALGCLIRACNRGSDRALDAIADAATHTRYDSVHGLLLDLTNRRDDRPLAAQPDSSLQSAARWTRRYRSPIVGVLATVALALLVTFGVQEVQKRRAQQAIADHNLAAMADLEAVLALDDAEVDAALVRWLDDPRWAGTSAVGRAWLERARGRHIAGDAQGSEDAAAQAFVVALREEDRDQAAEFLAEQFLRGARWSSLLRLGDSTQTQSWQTAAFAGQRDLVSAAESARDTPLFPLLSQWSQATRTPHKPTFIVDGPNPGTVLLTDQEAGFLRLTEADPELTVIASVPLNLELARAGLPSALPHGRVARRAPAGDLTISTVTQTGDTLVLTQEAAGPAYAIDLEQQRVGGLMRTFVGYGYPIRDLFELTDSAPAIAHLPTSAAASDVGPLLAVSLPDGSSGLVAAVGPWRAYDVRLFASDGPLELLDRQEIGVVTALAVVQTDPLVVAIGTSDKYANGLVLGMETPFGAGRGVYLKQVTQTGFEDRREISGDIAFQEGDTLRNILPGDFDGDGLTDLAVRLATPRGSILWLLRNNGDGYDSLIIDDVVPMYVRNIDSDPADELFVRINNDNYHMWVLGTGEQTVPVLPTVSQTPLLTQAVPEPLQAVIQLSELGLDRAAATLAENRSSRLAPEHERFNHVLQGQLWKRAGDELRAEVHLQAAFDLDPNDDNVREQLAQVQASQLKFAEARRTLGPTAGTPELRSRITQAEDHPVTHLSFPQDLWRFDSHNIDHIRTPVAGPHLDLDVTTGGGVQLSAGVTPTANEFSISYDMTMSRVELGSGIEIGLHDDVKGGWFTVNHAGAGGGRQINLRVGCSSEKLATNHERPIDNELDVQRSFAVHFSYNRHLQQARCRIREAGRPVVDHTWTLQLPPGRNLTLEVRSAAATTDVGTRAELRLSNMTVRGLQLAPPQQSPLSTAAELLFSGAYPQAAEAYAEAGRDDLAALAYLDGGALSSATPWLVAHPDHPLTQRLHRTRREVGPVLATADPEGYADRVSRDYSSSLRYTEASDVSAVLLHPALESLQPVSPDACELLRRRAEVQSTLGRTGPSLAILERIGQQPHDPALEYCKVAAYIHAAELLVGMGRTGAATQRIQQAIATSSIPDITRERLRRNPILKEYTTQ